MSSEQHNPDHASGTRPVHSDVSFESTDVNTGTILVYLLYLAIAVAIAAVVSVFIFRFTMSHAASSETTMPPSHEGVGPTMPPEPRLQGVPGHGTDPQEDLRRKNADDQSANEQYGWIDRQGGIAQIPVEDAMKIIVSKGLPNAPAPAAEKKK